MRITIWALIGCAYILGMISLFANVAYGLAITAGPERWLYAVAGGLGDLLKITVPFAISWMILTGRTHGRSGPSICGLFFWIAATLWSVVCATGLYEIVRAEKIGSTASIKETHRLVTLQAAELRSDLARLRSATPMEVAQANLRAMEQDRLFGDQRTKGCTDATAPDSIEFCKQWELARGVVATAIPASQRSAKINAAEDALNTANKRLAGLNLTTVLSATDPATAAFSTMTGLAQETVRGWLALAFGLLIELGGSIVPYILAPGLLARPKAAPEPEPEPDIAPIALIEVDNPVAIWLRSSIVRRRGCSIPAAEAYAAYKRWALDRAEPVLNQRAFGAEMTALGIERRKSGVVLYEHIALSIVEDRPRLRVISA